jgi:hypothetical protein
LVPPSDSGNDFVGIICSFEWASLGVCFDWEPLDCALQLNDEAEDGAFAAIAWSGFTRSPSTALSQEVGVKWNGQRGWRASQARTLGC